MDKEFWDKPADKGMLWDIGVGIVAGLFLGWLLF